MAKRKGFDVIEDAHELAQHNYHHAYWVNRVISYTYATWMAEKKLSLIILPILIVMWVAVVSNLISQTSNEASFWEILFDFRDSASTSRFISFLFLVFYTTITIIASIQTLFMKRPSPTEQTKKKETKKKHPKRRKDYGRN